VNRAWRESLGVDVQVAQHIGGQAHHVRLVVDREGGRVTQELRIPAEDPHSGGVERRDPHLLHHRSDQAPDPRAHLVGGLVGERDGEHLER